MTKIYGASDDLIIFEGDFSGEGSGGDEETVIFLSDSTTLSIAYANGGVWKIEVLRKGSLFDKIEICTDPTDDPYSDIIYFKEGIKWAYAAKDCEKIN